MKTKWVVDAIFVVNYNINNNNDNTDKIINGGWNSSNRYIRNNHLVVVNGSSIYSS